MKNLITTWLAIGQKNSWIRQANDPVFSKSSFCKCHSLDTLIEELLQGNWCLGQAFYFKNICLIQQIDGGDEWLVIKEDTAFESFTASAIGADNLKKSFLAILASSTEQCRKLEYSKNA